MYTLNHVRMSYGVKEALSDINCTIPVDQFVVVVGPSGSGKSTLLRLLGFVEAPSFGTVSLELNQRTFARAGERPWPEVTCVFQKQFLWPHMTLRRNIELPLWANHVVAPQERIDEVVELFGMTEFVDRYPNEVSGGQAQRAALARALALRPSLILIDEAHGGLDLEQQARVNQHLLDLRNRGVGLIVVTHSIDFARKYADFLFVLDEGRIVESGPAKLLESPRSNFLKSVLAF